MKKEHIIFLVLILALGGAAFVFSRKNSQVKPKALDNQLAAPASTPISSPSPTPSPAATKPAGLTAKLSYGEAIKKYQYRIQFVTCHGNPGSVSLKRNTPLMLDNRDDKSHTIKVAGQSYGIKAYDYALAYIAKEGTYNLTCDGGGAATVNIEK